MWASQYSGIGPVARAVEGCYPAASTMRRRSAAEVLAGMLDLQASVRLAHCIGAEGAGPADVSWRAPLLLGDYVQKRLEAIQDATNRRLARPFDGTRVRVPDPPQLLARLLSSGAAESRPAARAFATETWSAYRDYFLSSAMRARAEVAALREEVGSDLREASPRGARLEALDAVVRAALGDAVPGLCDRLAAAMESPFVDALARAAESLPVAAEASAIAPWFAERGVLGSQLARTAEITRALLAREARALATLVQAACDGGGW